MGIQQNKLVSILIICIVSFILIKNKEKNSYRLIIFKDVTAATKNLVSLRQRLVVFRNAVIFNFIGKYFLKQLKLRCNCRVHLYRITHICYCNQHQAGRRLSVQNHVLFRRLKNAAVFYSIFYSVFLTYVYGDII